eukprot:12720446-Alexandrium_andersonii.AAC.1
MLATCIAPAGHVAHGTFGQRVCVCSTALPSVPVVSREPWGLRGRRIGEARIPGPSMVFTSANVTSYFRNASLVHGMDSHIIGLQETAVSAVTTRQATNCAGAAGFQSTFTPAINSGGKPSAG